MSALQRRIGPWPVWAWGGIIVAGAGLGLVLRRSSLFGDAEPEPPAEEGEAVPDGEYLERPTLPTTGAVPLPVVTTPSGTSNRPTTNLAWGQMAVEWLIAQNVPPVTAQAAVAKYLEGVALTAQEAAVLALALRQLGPAPEGAPVPQAPAPSVPNTPTDPRTPQPLRSTYPVKARGDRGGAWLGWTSVPGATHYQLRQKAGGAGWSGWVDVRDGQGRLTTQTTTFKRNLVRRKTNYGFQVRAVKGSQVGPAAQSNTVPISP